MIVFRAVCFFVLFLGCAISKGFAQEINADRAYKAFSELTTDIPPDRIYEVFNQFCLHYFGAKSDKIYQDTFGEQLVVEEENHWMYISEKSSSLAWETNLPAKTYVEYGNTPNFGMKTAETDRFYFNHLHYLKDLKPNTEYYYRLMAEDEFGNSIASATRKFKTRSFNKVIYIPGNLGNPPYILDQPNATYLLTDDIESDKSAIVIAAEDITLDLGGNTIIHGKGFIKEVDYNETNKSGTGIRWRSEQKQSGLKIFNGQLKQGSSENNQHLLAGESMLKPDAERREMYQPGINRGFGNIEIQSKSDVVIAGVTAEYHLPQSWGMRFDDAFGKYDIHHNVFIDKGTQMFDRHGAGGARSLGFSGYDMDASEERGNELKVHHNLIKRTRQNALNRAKYIYNNEIYVDSWVVNSFAIQPFDEKGEVHDNKIFLTGYYSCGILWASNDLSVRDNFIHMESVKTMIEKPNRGRRLIETWGEQDVLAGMRITNYGKGGQVRENLRYENNVIFGRSRDGGEMRGTEFFSDYSNKNLIFKNNFVKTISMDTIPAKVSTINTQGAYNDRSLHLPIVYENTTSISNTCNIRFGDDYGQGSNHRFINCKFINPGEHPDYHTFIFDGENAVFNHQLLDCDFGPGTRSDDVYWENTTSLSNYGIKWTLLLETPAEAKITIRDQFGKLHFEGHANSNGLNEIPLSQMVIRPVEWAENKDEVPVVKKSHHQKELFSPYTVEVIYKGAKKTEMVTIVKKQTLKIGF
ncbi:MAG: fibronectin type III domain-containing protein [Cyclobacteriaceae bacterium]